MRHACHGAVCALPVHGLCGTPLVALHGVYAATKDPATVVAALIDTGADMHAANEDGGDTPLHLATQYNKVGAARVLVARGANAGQLNEDGESAMDLARNKRMRSVLAGE